MIVDTNILVRAWAGDDRKQTERARSMLAAAGRVYVSNVAMCEFVWAARKIYRQNRAEIARAIRLLMADERIVADRTAIDAGLAFMEAGGDFADGVIEFEGRRLGGEAFATFDRKAASIIQAKGRDCVLLDAD